MKHDYQEITHQIAREGGLELDNRNMHDPLHRAQMQRAFLHRFSASSKHKWLKIIVGFLCQIPAFTFLFAFISSLTYQDQNTAFDLLLSVLFSLLLAAVGFKLIVNGFEIN